MAVRTEEVRTVFTWDTSDTDKGVRRLETALKRAKDAQNGTRQTLARHGKDSDFALGMRDLAEGRGVNAMQRFGHTLGSTALRLSAYMLAIRAAGESTRYLREEMEKTDAAARANEQAFVGHTRAAQAATSGQKPATLTGNIKAMDDAHQAENDLQVGAARAAEMLKAMKKDNPLSAATAAAIEAVHSFQGKRSPEEESEAAGGRADYYARQGGRLRGLRSESFGHETEIAGLQGPMGNPYDAKRKELELQEKIEHSEAKAAGVGKKDLEQIKERFRILRETVTAEEAIFNQRVTFRRGQLGIERSAMASFGKNLALSSDSRRNSMSLIASGNLTEPEAAAEQNNVFAAENRTRQILQSRYLNADGSMRRGGAINRDFRTDRREERRRGRFNRMMDRGLIDPVTGRRKTGGDAAGSGLRTGGLGAGPAGPGLQTGSLSDYTNFGSALEPRLGSSHLELSGRMATSDNEWRKMFPKAGQKASSALEVYGPPMPTKADGAAAGGNTDTKGIGDLHQLLDRRLPKEGN
jgi:hypothetical protein